MQQIWSRLIYYGIGLLIGIIFVTILFGTRGCNWFPENRIKASVLSQILVTQSDQLLSLEDKRKIVDHISKGDVVFDKSVKSGEPKAYFFESEVEQDYYFQVIFKTDGVVSFFKPIQKSEEVSTTFDSEWMPVIHVPGDSNFISYHEDVAREIAYLKLNRELIHYALEKDGYAESKASEKDEEGREIHKFRFQVLKTSYLIKARVYKNTLQILYIEAEPLT